MQNNHLIDLQVPQRGYAVCVSSGQFKRLITHNVLSCTAIAGINRTHQIGFLCHFDTPLSTCAFEEIANYIASKTPNGAKFETHVYPGCWCPNIRLSLLTRHIVVRRLRMLPNLFDEPTKHGFSGILSRRSVVVDVSNMEITSCSYFWARPEAPYAHSLISGLRKMWLTKGSA